MAESINIRMISHFLYCPHRWGLIEIDNAWAENYFVIKANLQHERVHNSESSYTSRSKKVFTAVKVWNDDYDIFGVTDCIEVADDNSLCIIEYKPKMPEDADYHETDAMQVFAQKLCVDFVFGGNSKAAVYYANVKKRVMLPFDSQYETYDNKLKTLLSLMRTYSEQGVIPPIQKGQNCSGCSMKDLCMPKNKKIKNVRSRIEDLLEEKEYTL